MGDMCGPSGLTTEAFVDKVLEIFTAVYDGKDLPASSVAAVVAKEVDTAMVKTLFDQYDLNSDGAINLAEFQNALVKLGVAPMKVVESKSKESELITPA